MVMKTALIVKGNETDEGYEVQGKKPRDKNRRVEQHCLRRGCWKSRKRPDLNVEDFSRRDEAEGS